ncbi:Bgt-19 [Blumeria graminis f. sp. tritici]|uniref:Trafficking protein particle complex subunit n=3 Tax=Blumeria graminis f. sp. tritici TaxID=62690 RepID=A0A656KKS5_BLUGR|nr:subunit of the transport protein particle (TRAPP) complex [Blumeria graminis f. sp. tritici 96224]VDB93642.1 Bgt-19 [Blumeria graminis f. sp. tritici]
MYCAPILDVHLFLILLLLDRVINSAWYRVVYALLIINKAGGLVYQRDFADGLNKLSINDYLVLAGTFHGVHAIATRLHPLQHLESTALAPTERPEPPSGIEVLETENFRMQCFSTLTGTKFLLFTEPQQPNVDLILSNIYELYVDYVMKNPFYQLEMPVRCEGWERRLVGCLRVMNSK